jgi:hypothetical protein
MSTSAISVSRPASSVRESGQAIYVGMAALFIVVAVIGFGPRSLAIVTGQMPVPALIVHIHAATMSAWLALFLAQTLLMRSGRHAAHRSLGVASFVIAPAMFITMSLLVIGISISVLDPAAAAPLEVRARSFAFMTFVMARAALLFGLFYVWAFLTRKTDRETHKRMMVLATFVVIDAALGRMTWLPGAAGGQFMTADAGYDAIHFYQLLLIVPAIANDLLKRKRVHWSYLLGTGLFLACVMATHVAWGSARWQQWVAGWAGLSS